MLFVRCIQIMERMANLFPKSLAQESIKSIANCIKFKTHTQVHDEAANFLLSVCSDFDDAKSLLPIEKLLPKTKEEGEPVEEEFVANFNREPKKSQRQLQKLIAMLKANIMPHDEFVEFYKRHNPNAIVKKEETVLQRITGHQAKREASRAEELAHILIMTFGRKTSVVFDTTSICELFSHATEDREILA